MFGTSPLFFADNRVRTGQGGIDSFTKLMLHCDGANGGTTFTDSSSSAKTVTPTNVTTSTAQFKFATASALHNNATSVLSTPANADFNVGSGDFTCDFWIRPTSLATTSQGCYVQTTNANNYTALFLNSTGELQYYDYESAAFNVNMTTTSSGITTNNWFHVALVRNGSDFRIYVNGTSKVNATYAGAVASFTGAFNIGYQSGYTNPLTAYIDEFRWSKGIARWTTNFTPPTSAYTT